jgi:hypothetical protein
MINPVGKSWQTQDRFLELRSSWVTLIGEYLADDQGQTLEYWRVEKVDSVIILPLQNQQIIVPSPSYRPGVKTCTLDLPGGRVAAGTKPEAAAKIILERELGIEPLAITKLTSLNVEGWAVDSSFSNQKLWGLVIEIASKFTIDSQLISGVYPSNKTGVHQLLQDISCLQCRSVILEWWHQQNN